MTVFSWVRADVEWTPDGLVLRVLTSPGFSPDVAKRVRDSVLADLQTLWPDVVVEFDGVTLELVSDNLLEVNPSELRTRVEGRSRSAVFEPSTAPKPDSDELDAWVKAIRGRETLSS